MRELLDSSSQCSCVNQDFSTNYLEYYNLKTNSTTVIISEGYDLPADSITYYNTVTIYIAEHEEQIALDTMPLSHLFILEMPWLKQHNSTYWLQRQYSDLWLWVLPLELYPLWQNSPTIPQQLQPHGIWDWLRLKMATRWKRARRSELSTRQVSTILSSMPSFTIWAS